MISCTEKEEYKIDKEVLVDSEAFYSLKSKLNRLKK